MKFSFRKTAAFITALSMMTGVSGINVSAAARGMIVDNQKLDYGMRNEHNSAHFAVEKNGSVAKKSYPSKRETDIFNVIYTAANYYNRLGFNYNNTINTCYKTSYSYQINENVTTSDFYVSTSNEVKPGNIETAFGLITVSTDKGFLNKDFNNAQDVLAHEYVHLITQQKVHWDKNVIQSSLESGAVVEAYSDILGELSEANPDWKMGSGLFNNTSYCYRNIKSPESTYTPLANGTKENAKYYTDYNDFKSAIKYNTFEVDDGHGNDSIDKYYTGSTVLSHAAYLMNLYGIPKNDLAKIWLDSLDYFGSSKSNPTFTDCRKAVIAAANNYFKKYTDSTRADYLMYINLAFDSAHVYNTGTSTAWDNSSTPYPNARTSLKQGVAENNSTMSSFVRTETQKYVSGKYWSTDNVDNCSSANTGKENGITIGPTYDNGYYKSYSYAYQEPYFACAGFARKLQMDYYGTSKFLHLTETNGFTYSPRIGDHLRVAKTGRPGPTSSQHSIFITNVSGTKITYADCNSMNKNEIAWNKTGYISRTNGALSITLNGESKNFLWVERPVMIGDVNGDSVINSKDVSVLTEVMYGSASSYTANDLKKYTADINGDGKVNDSDSTLLKNGINSSGYLTSYGYVK